MLGIHVSKKQAGKSKKLMADSIRESIESIRQYNIARPCAQIFVSGPRSYDETLTPEDKASIRKYIVDNDIPLVIHGAYIDYPWTKSLQSIRNVMNEMQIAHEIGATGVIVHLGAGALNDDNFKFALDTIGKLPKDVRDDVVLWLEINTAKSSPATYETVEKITRLFERVEMIDHNLTIGLCIDTAHLFSCGKNLDTDQAARTWIEGLPVGYPIMMHLNDSASELGSGVDKHASLCSGGIWRNYHPITGSLPIENSGLVYLLGWAETNNIMTILERDDANADLVLIRQLGYFQ